VDRRDGASEPVARAIRARLIQTSLERATVFEPTDPQDKAWAVLSHANFDQAPVIENGVPVGYVRRADLRPDSGDSLAAHTRPILPSSLIAGDSQFEHLLPWLAGQGFLFVLDGREVSGFVVPSDVNKQAGRSYFYLLLAELEICLADLIRQRARHDPNLVISALTNGRSAAALRRYRKLQEKNVEADLVAELTLSDLFSIVPADESLRVQLGYWTESQCRADTRPITHLRNRVMHPTKPILEDQGGLEELLVVDQKARTLLDRLRVAEVDILVSP
jgi:hypothetical protein